MKFLIQGIFTAWVGSGEDKHQVAHFKNHVTDYGLNTLASKSLDTLMGTLHVGSGNTTPADSDTALATEVASTTSITLNNISESDVNAYHGRLRKYHFAAGVAEGTLAELGVSDGVSLFNRQLFRDYYDAPTTIVVGASDELDVLCEVRVYFEASLETKIDSGNVTINGQVFNHMLAYCGYWNSSNLLFPTTAINAWINTTSKVKLATTLLDYNDGSSGLTNTIRDAGITPSDVTVNSYVTDSFEQSFTVDFYSGTLDGRYDGLFLGSQYAYGIFFGLSPTYNTAAETVWQSSNSYTVDDLFISALGDEFIYKVITGGTSHTSAPTWPISLGGTVTDGGGVEYECIAPLLVVQDTEALSLEFKFSWGRA